MMVDMQTAGRREGRKGAEWIAERGEEEKK